MNPSIEEANSLKNWWNAEGGSSAAFISSNTGGGGGGGAGRGFEGRKQLASIKNENMGYSDKPDWLDCKATISFIKHDGTPWYQACPNMSAEGKKCMKKVIIITCVAAIFIFVAVYIAGIFIFVAVVLYIAVVSCSY